MVHRSQGLTIPGELVARLEAATAGSRHLDYEIKDAIDDPHWNPRVPADWTTSLDAALALAERVLPGWCWGIATDQRRGFGCILTATEKSVDVTEAYAPTPALALVLAILKALAATSPAVQVGIGAADEGGGK